eukprot:9464538-Pyramimonas_sp.AAC.1
MSTRIRKRCSSLPIEMGAFADDMGMRCRDVLQSLPTILRVLSDGGKASGLILNLAKCVLVIPSPAFRESVGADLRRVGVDIRQFKILRNG